MILALETSTASVGVALADGTGVRAACTLRAERRHVETLHVAVESLLARLGESAAGIEAVAVDVGPGMLTGVRVGVAAAKGIALACGVPAVGCTSLEVLRRAAGGGHVVPVVDLRRGEVAWLVGEPGRPGEPLAGTPDELAERVARLDAPVLLVGEGAVRYGGPIAESVVALGGPRPEIGPGELATPPVGVLATLGWERLRSGSSVDAVGLAALYLRPPDARANFASRADTGPGTSGGRW
ncbi:MAG: tRNA (adenosine(37)-N6)-threonylcarbamoyltransferase complex dimerization subunit type 1 TsaB [Actinomycetota bacterium]|nr:tRNA (adenosine(37)-N6)-threonylcarbamoyltransferase complex dimerization subunit type 1 TsaB [Actinomycetota bacterium]